MSILYIFYIIILAFNTMGMSHLKIEKTGYICKRNWLNTTVGFTLHLGWWSTV